MGAFTLSLNSSKPLSPKPLNPIEEDLLQKLVILRTHCVMLHTVDTNSPSRSKYQNNGCPGTQYHNVNGIWYLKPKCVIAKSRATYLGSCTVAPAYKALFWKRSSCVINPASRRSETVSGMLISDTWLTLFKGPLR